MTPFIVATLTLHAVSKILWQMQESPAVFSTKVGNIFSLSPNIMYHSYLARAVLSTSHLSAWSLEAGSVLSLVLPL
jgi:hypothetical protein